MEKLRCSQTTFILGRRFQSFPKCTGKGDIVSTLKVFANGRKGIGACIRQSLKTIHGLTNFVALILRGTPQGAQSLNQHSGFQSGNGSNFSRTTMALFLS